MKKFFSLVTALLVLGGMTVLHATTYTVAGDNATLFGTKWDPTIAANDMTLAGGLYVFSKQASLDAGEVKLKVCLDHAWTTAYPGSDYVLTIPADGEYRVIITYNPDNNAVNACVATTFTVAGDNTAVFGTGWTPTLAANDMALDGSVYKFEKEDVELAAGSIVFKVCTNHGWNVAFPKDNYNLAIAESGKYTVTITFDPSTCAVSAEATKTEDAVVVPTIALHGNFTGSWNDTKTFTLAENKETASLTATIAMGNYEFGVKVGGSWTSNGTAFSRENASHVVESGSGNLTLNADASGDYTFTWTFATSTLSVEYPEKPAEPEPSYTFPAGSTIYYDFRTYGKGINLYDNTWKDATAVASVISVKLGSDLMLTANTNLFKSEATADENNVWQFVKCTTLPTEGQNMIVSEDGKTFVWGTYVPAYTVAGAPAAVFGTEWDETNAANDMTLGGGIYTFEKTDVELPSGNVTFKVAKDHEWAQTWPTNNYVLSIGEAGIYTISITFNPAAATGEEISASATKTGDAEVTNSAGILGTWDDWGVTDALTLAPDGQSASITKNLAAGNYDFKIVVNGSDYRSNGYWYHRDYTGTEGITYEGGNMNFTADISGDYTFTWTFATNAISIEFPELSWTDVRTGLTAGNYYTICHPQKMVYVKGATLWSFAGRDADFAYLVQEEAPYAAGKPYIVYAEASKIEAVLDGTAETVAGTNGAIHGTFVNLTQESFDAPGAQIYLVIGNQLRRVTGQTSNILPAYRAYVELSEIPTTGAPAGMPAHKVRSMPLQANVATGMENIQPSEVRSQKILRDGQLYLLYEGRMYNVQGQSVK